MQTISLPQKTLEWLLDNDNPPVRNLTKRNLLNKSPTELELSQVNEYPPIKTILSLIKPNGSWTDPKNPYKKYTGNFWQYIFLCDLNADQSNEMIQKASEHIFSYQLPDGGFSHKLGFKKPIICLTANILRSLIHFGYEADKRVQKGVDLITGHIIDNQGVNCHDPIHILLSDCQMALTKVLAMYTYLEKKNRDSEIKRAINVILEKIVENQVYRYVPTGAREYQKAIKGKKTAQIRQIKSRFLKYPEKLNKTEIKSSWKRFGFPQSYTSDALETLYWLAKANSSYQPEFEEALDWIINHMDPSGWWINENTFRNPMLVKIEPKKAPSKWLTYRTCYVLNKFKNLKFQA